MDFRFAPNRRVKQATRPIQTASLARLTAVSGSDTSPATAAPTQAPTSLEDLPTDLQAALEERWRTAATAHRSLALPLAEFVEDLLQLWARGKQRLGLAMDASALRADIDRIHYEDLYLARLCERGDESAWRAFHTRYHPDLCGVLTRHVRAEQADEVASAVIADAALPPAKKADRTLLGTYEGSGPLWAWLATIAIRRVRKGWRRREAPLEAAGEPEVAAAPPATDLDAESQRFLRLLRAAWQALEPREALAVRWKHRDGLSQRQVARLLDTSEPTVSRIVGRAIAKLQGHLASAFPDLGAADDGLWARLEAGLSRHFASLPNVTHRGVEEA